MGGGEGKERWSGVAGAGDEGSASTDIQRECDEEGIRKERTVRERHGCSVRRTHPWILTLLFLRVEAALIQQNPLHRSLHPSPLRQLSHVTLSPTQLQQLCGRIPRLHSQSLRQRLLPQSRGWQGRASLRPDSVG
eukprot:TRINITY_DN1024_c0_g2_i1.p2 TRINITY_DN1024_c0_g2~~TRINITY_DN1024_c0_g2_i1.p2  ORF type:complete len:135 (-),score=10.62 TRINITY_DN1024_c0_g2_i1:45-449(-)